MILALGNYGCLWIRYLLPPRIHPVRGGRDCILLFSLCVIYGLLNDATNVVLLNFISPLFLLLRPWNSPFSISTSAIIVSRS